MILWILLVDVAVGDLVTCISFVLWVCLRETCTVFQDDPQYKGMKYLVFGTILSSLLSELQIIIPKIDRNGVCIGMVNPTL